MDIKDDEASGTTTQPPHYPHPWTPVLTLPPYFPHTGPTLPHLQRMDVKDDKAGGAITQSPHSAVSATPAPTLAPHFPHLKRMDVKDDKASGAPSGGRGVAEQSRQGGGCCHVTLRLYL